MKKTLFVLLTIALVMALPTFAQEAPTLDENLTEGCITEYDAETDYFPDKVSIDYAVGLEVSYFNNYKVVRATTPWPGAGPEDAFEYVLVQCGTPAPEGFENAQFIEVPTGNLITLSATQLPHISELGLIDKLIGIEYAAYITNEEVRDLVAAGEVIEVGGSPTLDIELVLEAEPSIVMSYSAGIPEYDSHPILLEAGVFVAMNNEWVEVSPLGRAEWLKFTALFYNEEAAANALFDEREAQYQELTALVADLSEDEKPLILPNAFSAYSEAWNIPGDGSYIGQLVHDAGGRLVLGDSPESSGQTGSVPFDFEVVYEEGLEADFWVLGEFGVFTLDDLLALDERYADFAPVANGTIWNNNALVNEDGGNAYWEEGVTHPEILLADLIAILHPDLLPDYVPTFYRPIE